MLQTYAVVENGKVTNVCVSETALQSNWVQSNIAKIGDEYVNGEFVTPPPDTSVLENEIRLQRNNLLAESDWTQVADAPVDKAAWAAYRQSLRDIPQQTGFPTEVTWPTAPGSV